jgi:hypothetical protein
LVLPIRPALVLEPLYEIVTRRTKVEIQSEVKGLGAIVGAILGGALASYAPSTFLKALLGVILIGSSLKAFSRSETAAD